MQLNSGDWYREAKIDYFSVFIKLWLSFNSFYKMIYINEGFGLNDRKHIEKIKNDDNILKTKFINLFEQIPDNVSETSDESREFKVYFIELIKRYDGGLFGGKKIEKSEHIKPQMNSQTVDEISFQLFIHPDSNHIKRRRSGFIKVDTLYIRDSAEEVWPYLIEVLYMIRNSLIHGEMKPTEYNHDIIKNCFYVLEILMREVGA